MHVSLRYAVIYLSIFFITNPTYSTHKKNGFVLNAQAASFAPVIGTYELQQEHIKDLNAYKKTLDAQRHALYMNHGKLSPEQQQKELSVVAMHENQLWQALLWYSKNTTQQEAPRTPSAHAATQQSLPTVSDASTQYESAEQLQAAFKKASSTPEAQPVVVKHPAPKATSKAPRKELVERALAVARCLELPAPTDEEDNEIAETRNPKVHSPSSPSGKTKKHAAKKTPALTAEEQKEQTLLKAAQAPDAPLSAVRALIDFYDESKNDYEFITWLEKLPQDELTSKECILLSAHYKKQHQQKCASLKKAPKSVQASTDMHAQELLATTRKYLKQGFELAKKTDDLVALTSCLFQFRSPYTTREDISEDECSQICLKLIAAYENKTFTELAKDWYGEIYITAAHNLIGKKDPLWLQYALKSIEHEHAHSYTILLSKAYQHNEHERVFSYLKAIFQSPAAKSFDKNTLHHLQGETLYCQGKILLEQHHNFDAALALFEEGSTEHQTLNCMIKAAELTCEKGWKLQQTGDPIDAARAPAWYHRSLSYYQMIKDKHDKEPFLSDHDKGMCEHELVCDMANIHCKLGDNQTAYDLLEPHMNTCTRTKGCQNIRMNAAFANVCAHLLHKISNNPLALHATTALQQKIVTLGTKRACCIALVLAHNKNSYNEHDEECMYKDLAGYCQSESVYNKISELLKPYPTIWQRLNEVIEKEKPADELATREVTIQELVALTDADTDKNFSSFAACIASFHQLAGVARPDDRALPDIFADWVIQAKDLWEKEWFNNSDHKNAVIICNHVFPLFVLCSTKQLPIAYDVGALIINHMAPKLEIAWPADLIKAISMLHECMGDMCQAQNKRKESEGHYDIALTLMPEGPRCSELWSKRSANYIDKTDEDFTQDLDRAEAYLERGKELLSENASQKERLYYPVLSNKIAGTRLWQQAQECKDPIERKELLKTAALKYKYIKAFALLAFLEEQAYLKKEGGNIELVAQYYLQADFYKSTQSTLNKICELFEEHPDVVKKAVKKLNKQYGYGLKIERHPETKQIIYDRRAALSALPL